MLALLGIAIVIGGHLCDEVLDALFGEEEPFEFTGSTTARG